MRANLPLFITFTGADDRTDPAAMAMLSEHYPVEWGVLFSRSQQGFSNRFPRTTTTLEAADVLLAAHLCGVHVRRIMEGLSKPLFNLTPYRRVQINHHDGHFDIDRVLSFANHITSRVICHFRDPDAFPSDRRVEWLFDASFGAGIEPERWPPHPGGVTLVGYSGGIGPDNVRRIIEKIDAKGPYWIDMENGVRTDDWLDIAKCRQVCEAVYGGYA